MNSFSIIMKKSILIPILAAFFTVQGYSQTEDIVDFMMNSYIKYYELAHPKSEVIDNVVFFSTDDMPADFLVDFDTLAFKFNRYDCKTSYNRISFMKANAKPPLNHNLVETSEPFVWRDFEGEVKCHGGIDLALKKNENDTIYSVFSGRVRYIFFEKNGYGHFLIIRGYNGIEILYAHLDGVPFVGRNQDVKAGDPIGIGGSSGRSSGPHLHFEVNYKNKPVNPYDILEKFGLKKIH